MTLGPELVGRDADMTVVVSADMAAAFDDEHVHPVYGTAALVRHAEQVSRRLLVPHLEAGTEGVGAHISVRQHAPVAVGATVQLRATVIEAGPRRLVTTVDVSVADEVVATASFTQAVVDLDAWRSSARR
jgi:predicted thioesterase